MKQYRDKESTMRVKLMVISFICTFPLFLVGCAAVVMPTIRVNYAEGIKPSDIVTAAALVLQKYDFTLTLADPKAGFLVTDWRAATTRAEEVVSTVLSTVLYGPLHPSYGDPYRQRIKLSLNVDRAAQRVLLKPIKQGSSKIRGWYEVKLDSGDTEMLQNIVVDMVTALGGKSTDIEWEGPLQYQEPEKDTIVQRSRRRDVIAVAAFGTIFLTIILLGVAGGK